MLTTLHAVVGKAGGEAGQGSKRAVEDYAQGCRCMLSVLCEISQGEKSLTTPEIKGLLKIWGDVLPLCAWAAKATVGGEVFLSEREAKTALIAIDRLLEQANKGKINCFEDSEITNSIKMTGQELLAACSPEIGRTY